jgi:TPR repeat protein
MSTGYVGCGSSPRTRRRAIRFDSVSCGVGRFLSVGTAAVVAFLIVGEFPPWADVDASENRTEATSFGSRFEAPPFQTTPPTEATTTGIAANNVAGDRQLDREEIALLRRRGEEFVLVGDITSARLLLRRAAEAYDARAALTLAAIHDPIVLDNLGVLGVAADTATARIWYEKSKELGYDEAAGRLELLADRGPLSHLRDECEALVRRFASDTLGRVGARHRTKAPL